MPVPTNPDLPSSWELPGVYFSIDLSGQGAGVGSLDKRVLLLGYRLASGTKAPDQPFLVNGESDADQFFGRGSGLARMARAALAQVGAGVIDLWCCGINEPSGGTLATHLIAVAGTATSAGSVDVYVAGHRASVAIASGDTATAIAANMDAEIDKLLDAPVTSAAVAGTVTLTARHRGFAGNDLPVRVDQFGAAGVTFSPGTLTYSGVTVGAGSATVKASSTTISAAIADTDTAAAVAGKINTAINAGAYPVRSSVSGAVVTLLYASERYVHNVSAAIVTSTGVSATPAVGVQPANSGAERPTLTTALTNIAGLSGFSAWATEYNEVTSMGAISTHIETQGNGINQKGQVLHIGSTDSLTVAGAIPPGSTPALTASPRYALDWCPESPQQAYELAARTAAMVAAEDYAPRNYDGKKLKTNAVTPLLLPARAIRPSDPDKNAAIHTYFMTPLAVDEIAGALVIVSGKTTSSSADLLLHDWGTIRHIDFLRAAFRRRLATRFAGVNLRRNGVPHTTNTVTTTNIKDAAFVLAIELDAIDLYDGAEAFKSGFTAEIDSIVPTRVNMFIPLAVVRALHQLGVVGAPV